MTSTPQADNKITPNTNAVMGFGGINVENTELHNLGNLRVSGLGEIIKANEIAKNQMSEFVKLQKAYEELSKNQLGSHHLEGLKNIGGIFSPNEIEKMEKIAKQAVTAQSLFEKKIPPIKNPIYELQKDINANNKMMFETIEEQLKVTVKANEIQSEMLASLIATQSITETNANDALKQSEENRKLNKFNKKIAIIGVVIGVIGTIIGIIGLFKS